nr:hypothetical protein CPGR_02351 [Mycolicibacterium fortuitum subsp. fortuitum DSM 46621 = ATCC 6841 = JCM 6387]CRL82832.1 hypothetical protein CPGR_06059 [Mycolicibacter nonchromogenicus]
MMRLRFRRYILGPIRLIIAVIVGSLVVRLAIDEALQGPEDCGRHRLAGSDCCVGSGNLMADQTHPDAVDRDVVAAYKKVELFGLGLQQRELEQRPVKRHGRLTDRCDHPVHILHRIGRLRQVVVGELDIWIVDQCLEDLAVHL